MRSLPVSSGRWCCVLKEIRHICTPPPLPISIRIVTIHPWGTLPARALTWGSLIEWSALRAVSARHHLSFCLSLCSVAGVDNNLEENGILSASTICTFIINRWLMLAWFSISIGVRLTHSSNETVCASVHQIYQHFSSGDLMEMMANSEVNSSPFSAPVQWRLLHDTPPHLRCASVWGFIFDDALKKVVLDEKHFLNRKWSN